ncbi:MAG: DUF4251 domain-containing protein [Paludibacter sp.]|nr:DUF4251 domain-containing protein [Paludibacter sp.]
MEMSKKSWLWMLVFLFASCSVGQKVVKISKTLQQKVETKDFTIFVARCLPSDLENLAFNSDVVLKVKNDSAYANLPFHGLLNVKQLETPTDPISFNGPMKEFSMTQNPTVGWNVTFKIESKPYIYQVFIQIATNGKAVAKITSTTRTTMTYFGDTD